MSLAVHSVTSSSLMSSSFVSFTSPAVHLVVPRDRPSGILLSDEPRKDLLALLDNRCDVWRGGVGLTRILLERGDRLT